MKNASTCRCHACPADILSVRALRGLAPLCELTAKPTPAAGFSSYAEAAAAALVSGGTARIMAGTGLRYGNAARFAVVGAA